MEWIVLGSGTAVPNARRALSAHWLQTEQGSILMEAGGGGGLTRAASELLLYAAYAGEFSDPVEENGRSIGSLYVRYGFRRQAGRIRAGLRFAGDRVLVSAQ